MDLDIEKIHSVLQDAKLPSTIHDIKNPNEEYVVNLIQTFLTRFNIDVSFIDKPTIEQQDIMIYSEGFDIIGLINLHVVMVQISDRIFIKDLCITDITSPGSKRLRRQAKFLANFILYATNKQSDIQDRVDEIRSRAKYLQDILDRKNEVQESMNEKAVNNSKQLLLKEKYMADIEKIQATLEMNNRRYLKLVSETNVADKRKTKAMELCASHKTQATKLSNTINELQSEVVKSPEELRTRLRDAEERHKLKQDEQKIMEETFINKKQLIEQQENTLTFMQKQLQIFPEMKETYEHYKKVTVERENSKKQIEQLRSAIAQMETNSAIQEDQFKGSEVNELHAQYEERLSPLRNVHAQLMSNKKSAAMQLKEGESHYNKVCSEINEMQSITRNLEEETLLFTKGCQELYDNEIMIENDLLKTFTEEE